eukprot:6039520-Amphidinium_carterae.1
MSTVLQSSKLCWMPGELTVRLGSIDFGRPEAGLVVTTQDYVSFFSRGRFVAGQCTQPSNLLENLHHKDKALATKTCVYCRSFKRFTRHMAVAPMVSQ